MQPEYRASSVLCWPFVARARPEAFDPLRRHAAGDEPRWLRPPSRPAGPCCTGITDLPGREGAAPAAAATWLRIQGIRAQDRRPRRICTVEGRLWAAVLPACRASRTRTREAAAGIERLLANPRHSQAR